MSKKTKRSISTFAILLAVMLLVSIATWLAAGKTYTGDNGELAEVVGATSSDIFMAPVNGWADAADVITFVFCLGAFLAIVNATGALETGIHTLVRKLHGKELVLVWILMFLFSVGGTTYGMGEETVGFYILLAATIILPAPLLKWFGLYGLIPELLIWGAAMYFALRLERIKKANNVQSYREILAFSEGRKLDEIEQKVEAGKRPYQKLLLVLLTAGITLLVGMVLSWLLL